jgi:hypothetical protein
MRLAFTPTSSRTPAADQAQDLTFTGKLCFTIFYPDNPRRNSAYCVLPLTATSCPRSQGDEQLTFNSRTLDPNVLQLRRTSSADNNVVAEFDVKNDSNKVVSMCVRTRVLLPRPSLHDPMAGGRVDGRAGVRSTVTNSTLIVAPASRSFHIQPYATHVVRISLASCDLGLESNDERRNGYVSTEGFIEGFIDGRPLAHVTKELAREVVECSWRFMGRRTTSDNQQILDERRVITEPNTRVFHVELESKTEVKPARVHTKVTSASRMQAGRTGTGVRSEQHMSAYQSPASLLDLHSRETLQIAPQVIRLRPSSSKATTGRMSGIKQVCC